MPRRAPASAPAPPPAGTSTYAVLGMLALRPLTPYELTQQVRRSLRYCWPVSERALYSEPERLVAAGLASVSAERVGRRTRRTYSITRSGRAALREWLASEPSAPRFQFEAMLRVLFADLGDKDDLVRSLESFRDSMEAMVAEGVAQVEPYLHGGGPFPERAHIVAMFGALYGAIAEAIVHWANGAIAEVENWEDVRDLGVTAEARQRLEQLVARHGGPR